VPWTIATETEKQGEVETRPQQLEEVCTGLEDGKQQLAFRRFVGELRVSCHSPKVASILQFLHDRRRRKAAVKRIAHFSLSVFVGVRSSQDLEKEGGAKR